MDAHARPRAVSSPSAVRESMFFNALTACVIAEDFGAAMDVMSISEMSLFEVLQMTLDCSTTSSMLDVSICGIGNSCRDVARWEL